MSYRVVFTKHAEKDAQQVARAGLRPKAERILAALKHSPFQTPPRYEKVLGDLGGAYSRRLNIQHRIVYQVYERERVVKIIRTWTHYE